MSNQPVPSENIINVVVLSPEETLFSGQATALTCHNEQGDFDVLPLHTNFISYVSEYVIIHLTNGETKKITIGNALLKALENNITVLLNIDLSEKDVVFQALFKQLEDKQTATTTQQNSHPKK